MGFFQNSQHKKGEHQMKNYSEIEYKGTKIKLVFNLNVMEAIQDEFGSVDKWGKLTDGESGEVNVKALKFGFTEMINEAIDIDNEENGTSNPFYTPKQVARIITDLGMEQATEALNKTVIDSTKDDSEKNA
jgi:hypothetical protein